MSAPKLLFVGCGKMGSVLLERVAHDASVCVVDPLPPTDQLKLLSGVAWLASPDQIGAQFIPDMVVFAVKPQMLASAAPHYARFKDSLFVSIVAGKTLSSIGSILGSSTIHAIVRTMPSILASIGESMTLARPNPHVTAGQRALCERFFNAAGKLVWIDDEGYFDAITALSGSGPAYVFALVEAMTKAGEVLRLPPTLAAKLARHTVQSTGAMLAQVSESPETMRKSVTSPGGTTEAALKSLLAPNGGLDDLILKAVKNAAERSKNLGG